ncbi:MAG: hypothetical protein HY720_26405 [Planctomycetes bacterium]|nr:hypothetical protein [Planctomycetota bacterium]
MVGAPPTGWKSHRPFWHGGGRGWPARTLVLLSPELEIRERVTPTLRLFLRHRYPEEAWRAASMCLDRFPADPELPGELASLFLEHLEFGSARILSERRSFRFSTTQYIVDRLEVMAAREKGDSDRAAELQAQVDGEPQDEGTLGAAAVFFESQSLEEAAMVEWERVLATHWGEGDFFPLGYRPQAWERLAFLLADRGELSRAAELLLRRLRVVWALHTLPVDYLVLTRSGQSGCRATLHDWRAKIALSAGDAATALRESKMSLAFDPFHVSSARRPAGFWRSRSRRDSLALGLVERLEGGE